MALASSIAAALDIRCAPPCATTCTRAPCTQQPRALNATLPTGGGVRSSCECLDWQSNVDSTLMLTR
eukprot:3210771-Prymnesium_polylepis.3